VVVVTLITGFRLGYPPLTHQYSFESTARDEDPYAQDTAAFLREIRAIEALSPGFRRFNWSAHGPLEAARWGIGAPIRVMAVGQLHAREPFSAELLRLWMISMITSKKPDTGIIDWLFVPVANPCGRDLFARGYRSLRDRPGANRTAEWQVCQRTNCAGVDLNRNWATERGLLGGPDNGALHWDRGPETNPGSEAFSEPETHQLRLLLHDFGPHILFNVHTGTDAIKTSPEDGAKTAPRNIESIRRLKSWITRTTGCCLAQDRLGAISQGSMTDYASRKILTPFPVTLEVYRGANAQENFTASAPEYHGAERYGDDATNCLMRFNPRRASILEAAIPWLRLWRALFYLRDRDLHIIRNNTETVN
jgi:hypothetical protein